MLGTVIKDPDGIEGPAGQVPGIGLLQVETTMTPKKILTEVSGIDLSTGANVEGYEIHIGHSEGSDCKRPWLEIEGMEVGASSKDGLVRGCYVHGIFSSDTFRSAFLTGLGAEASEIVFEDTIDKTLDDLGNHIEEHLDVEKIWDLAAEINCPSTI
jgi:adenosylcobyric acid synthase